MLWMSFFFFPPVFTVTGKLKAHGSSQACFEFSDPRPATWRSEWLLNLLLGSLAPARVRFVVPMAAEGQGCSEGASEA